MSQDLPEFPIVELESDFPEQIGQMGLFEYLMPVGSTGIIFIAEVPGRLEEWGVYFSEPVKHISKLRAASTLAQMGIIRGELFAFLRESLRLTQADIATMDGVSLETVQGWEDNSIPIPIDAWGSLASQVCSRDGRIAPTEYSMTPDFRPRRIRVFPNIPTRSRIAR